MLNEKNKKFFLTILLFFFNSLIFASDDIVHNTQMLQVLFGKSSQMQSDDGRLLYIGGFTGNKKESLLALQKAVYWCVDEYNGHLIEYARPYLNDLVRFGVDNVPQYDKINFTANQYHGRYTHMGWDHTYPRGPRYDFQEIWGLRKNLLLSTVERVFNFQPEEMYKKDSFAALLYYVHILGDHSANTKSTLPTRMRVNRRLSLRGRTVIREDILWELEHHISQLFREQTNATEYRAVMNYLQRQATKPEFTYAQTISDDEYKELQSFAKGILDNLVENIPALLSREKFFLRVFP